MTHLFSDVKAFRHDPLKLVLDYGTGSSQSLVRLRLGFQPYYLVRDPRILKEVLKADEANIDKGRLVNKLKPIVGNSSLVISGDEQRRRRAAIHTRLARSSVEPLIPELCASIRQCAASLARENSFDANNVASGLALSLISVILFGKDALSKGDQQSLMTAIRLIEDELANEMFRAFPMMPWTALARRRRLAAAKNIMSVVVQRVRKKTSGSSVINQLEALGLSDDDIRDEILTMLIAGHHTTGSSAAWILYHLAIDPALAERVATESASICDNHGDIRPSLLKTATTSYALVRESLRLHPSIWWFARETKNKINIAGQTIEKNASLVISPWHLHRDPNFWDNPEEFKLDRNFSNPAYVPFGFGPRACVGMGVALLNLQLIAMEFSVAYQLSYKGAENNPTPKASVTLVPPPLPLHLDIRSSENVEHAAA